MEHVSQSAINIGSKKITISRARSDDTIIHINQAGASIDRRGQSDRDISFLIRKSFNEMNIDFGWNTNNRIHVKPSMTTGIIGT